MCAKGIEQMAVDLSVATPFGLLNKPFVNARSMVRCT
jgi:hypothetical protein